MQKKILLAEDDSDDQMFFFDFLEHRQDIQLLPVATDGVDLFEYLDSAGEQALPDAIILDQNMPRRNGLQTLKMLKETARYSHIPVMVYSTYTDENLVKHSLAGGAALVFPKPSDAAGYKAMIDALLGAVSSGSH